MSHPRNHDPVTKDNPQNLLWAIFSGSYFLSIKLSLTAILFLERDMAVEFSLCIFFVFWAPQSKRLLVPLYSREGRHLYGRYEQHFGYLVENNLDG